MQVQTTNNNPNFGTKVLMRPGTKDLIECSKAKERVYKQIENLKNNGVNDFLILSHNEIKDNEPYINAEIIEFIGNDCFMNAHTYRSFLEEKQEDTTKSYLDIDYLYRASREKMIKIGMITKQIFETFIHEYQEM